jgi:hypothetical protein
LKRNITLGPSSPRLIWRTRLLGLGHAAREHQRQSKTCKTENLHLAFPLPKESQQSCESVQRNLLFQPIAKDRRAQPVFASFPKAWLRPEQPAQGRRLLTATQPLQFQANRAKTARKVCQVCQDCERLCWLVAAKRPVIGERKQQSAD